MSSQDTNNDLKFAVLATDIVVFRYFEHKLQVLLIDVYSPSVFVGKKAFPGGLIHPVETAEDSVLRLVEDKGGISRNDIYIEQLYTFSTIDRDPRGRVVSVAYMGTVRGGSLKHTEVNPYWANVSSLTDLAYDHMEILGKALKRLQSRIKYSTIAQYLLPDEFTLTDQEKMYEIILNITMDKRNFRKKVLKLHLVTPTGKKITGLQQRPAELYKFTEKGIQEENII